VAVVAGSNAFCRADYVSQIERCWHSTNPSLLVLHKLSKALDANVLGLLTKG